MQTKTTLHAIPNGIGGTKATLKAMRQLARDGKKNIRVRELALSLVQHLGQKDYYGEVEAIHRFVRDEVRYVKDIQGVETIHTVDKILDYMQGDCDDKSILVAALLASIGHNSKLCAVSFSPGRFSHVLVKTRIGKNWIPVETTENVNVGWFPPNVIRDMCLDV